MFPRRATWAATLAMGLLAAAPALATITVGLVPPNQTVNITDGTVAVQIAALIPQSDAIVAWGLDLDLLGSSVSILSVAVNSVDFAPTFAPDLDGLAGIIPTPPGSAIWSNPAAIVLATVTLSLDAEGLTTLTLSDDHATDANEGFLLNPPPIGAFADVSYVAGSINVVPEPTVAACLVLGGLVCLARRRPL